MAAAASCPLTVRPASRPDQNMRERFHHPCAEQRGECCAAEAPLLFGYSPLLLSLPFPLLLLHPSIPPSSPPSTHSHHLPLTPLVSAPLQQGFNDIITVLLRSDRQLIGACTVSNRLIDAVNSTTLPFVCKCDAFFLPVLCVRLIMPGCSSLSAAVIQSTSAPRLYVHYHYNVISEVTSLLFLSPRSCENILVKKGNPTWGAFILPCIIKECAARFTVRQMKVFASLNG